MYFKFKTSIYNFIKMDIKTKVTGVLGTNNQQLFRFFWSSDYKCREVYSSLPATRVSKKQLKYFELLSPSYFLIHDSQRQYHTIYVGNRTGYAIPRRGTNICAHCCHI